MDELRKLLNDLDTKAKEVKDLIQGEQETTKSDTEWNHLFDLEQDIDQLEYSITKYQEYKKWI